MKEIQYLKTRSATVLWLMKAVIGIFIIGLGIWLFSDWYPVIHEIMKESRSIMEALTELLELISTLIENYTEISDFVSISDFISVSDILSLVIGVLCIVYCMLYPLILILEAIAATLLRFTKKGIALLKVSHFIHMLAWILYFVSTLITLYQINFKSSELFKDIVGMLNVLLVVVALYELLRFCYHKDVMRALSTVRNNLTGLKYTPRKTHLSGIAVFRGISDTLFFCILLYAAMESKQSIDVVFGALLILVVVRAVKLFSVSACNRQIKSYNYKK